MKRTLAGVVVLALVALFARPSPAQVAGDGGVAGGDGGIVDLDGGVVDADGGVNAAIQIDLELLRRGQLSGAEFGALVSRLAILFGQGGLDGGSGGFPDGGVPGTGGGSDGGF